MSRSPEPPAPAAQTDAPAPRKRRRRWPALSLQQRILLAAAALLAVFVAATGLTLETAFRDSALASREARLLGQIYLLMAAAETVDGRLQVPERLDEPRFALAGSGLYGQISAADGRAVWRSPSAVGLDVPFLTRLEPGQKAFEQRSDGAGQRYLVKGFGVLWSVGPVARGYSFSVAEDQSELRRELARFRADLIWGLGLMSALLLLTLVLLLRWGLRPLRRVAAEVAAIETGERQRLESRYPPDLTPLTDNLNALLAHSEARQARLSNGLSDLAHSLKTPLSVMRGAVGEIETACAEVSEQSAMLREQIARMDRIVAYQLERARAGPASSPALAGRVELLPLAQRLGATLDRIHGDKAVELTLEIDPQSVFRGAGEDLMELLGNLLDNAYKWCRGRVRVQAWQGPGEAFIAVEDDGPGIDPALAQRLLERGTRADESIPGHGIGLAVVREITRAYGGEVEIGGSALGGARIQARLIG